MRYHSLLFAARAGVPIAAIPYAPKCDAWLREAGLEPVTPTGAALEAHLRKLLRQRKAA
jgi:polysaccharide pyruvyl transferase WcaK-like protein